MSNTSNGCGEGDTKTRIFTAAAQLFSDQGYHAVAMREISERSGVSKPMIYYYFGSKEGIYKALLDAGLEYSRNRFQDLFLGEMPVHDKMIEFVHRRFQDAIDYPELSKFYMTLFTHTQNMPFLDEFFASAIAEGGRLTDLIRAGIDSGELSPTVNPQTATMMIIGVVAHFLWHQMKALSPALTRSLAEEIVDLMLVGMKQPASVNG